MPPSVGPGVHVYVLLGPYGCATTQPAPGSKRRNVYSVGRALSVTAVQVIGWLMSDGNGTLAFSVASVMRAYFVIVTSLVPVAE